MMVYGVDAITAAAAAHTNLAIGRGDIVTPLARDLAAELGVEVSEPPRGAISQIADGRRSGFEGARGVWQPMSIETIPPRPISPPSPALYRRGAPIESRLLPRTLARTASVNRVAFSGVPATRVSRIVIVGAGHVGTITAMRLAEADLANEIVLVDVADGLAEGMALDISHSAALTGFTTALRGERTVESAGPAEFTVITAGKARLPGMSRTDLAGANAAILGPIARSIGITSPGGVILVVTNPLDEMTHLVWKSSSLPSSRVIGMAGMLDTARFSSLASATGIARADRIEGFAFGSHGDEMVIPTSLLKANGTALAAQMSASALEQLVTRTRDSGAEVVALLKNGSAFITPGLAAAQMVIRMIRGDERILCATVRSSGQYGIDGIYIGLPVRLDQSGLREIVDLELTTEELSALDAAARRIAQRVSVLSDLMSSA